MIVSYDPGSKAAGVALWDDDTRQLAAAWLARGDDWRDTAARAFKRLCGFVPMDALTVFAIEKPQVYTQRKQGGDPNDLITVALNAGAFGMCAEFCGADVLVYRPHKWKGQVPKKIAIKRFKRKLVAEEIARIELPSARSLRHNIWDAIGVGLYYWGR